MNTQVFVINDYNPLHGTVDTLLPYELGLYAYDKGDLMIKNANTVNNAVKAFIAVGGIANEKQKSRISRDINLPVRQDRNFSFKKFPFKSPVKSKSLISFSCLGQTSGDEFVVKISTQFGGFVQETKTMTRTYSVNGKFSDSLSLYKELASSINYDVENANTFGNQVLATATLAGLEISSTVYNQTIQLSGNYVQDTTSCNFCEDCKVTVCELISPSGGSGYPESIKEYWRAYSSYEGTIFSESKYLKTLHDDLVLLSNQYDMYQITWSNNTDAQEDNSEVFNIHRLVYIFSPVGLDISMFIQTLEHFFGSTVEVSPVQV